ncbi:MAG: SH3 domain-containing protein [Treponema sp.]|nr:SH3 domain-containing protein [Clostridia bacterium]MBP3606697.1 SH3 domain-containing protein [Treponema sp.]
MIKSEFKDYSAFNVKIKEASEIEQGIINDSSVRLRTEPSSDSSIILLLEKGDKVSIIRKWNYKESIDGESWYWYEVETSDGKTGWVYGKYLDIENE